MQAMVIKGTLIDHEDAYFDLSRLFDIFVHQYLRGVVHPRNLDVGNGWNSVFRVVVPFSWTCQR